MTDDALGMFVAAAWAFAGCLKDAGDHPTDARFAEMTAAGQWYQACAHGVLAIGGEDERLIVLSVAEQVDAAIADSKRKAIENTEAKDNGQ